MQPPQSYNELPSLSSSLLDRVQQMHPDAWARMVDVFSPIVYRWSRTAGLSGADSADVVQDVFIAIAKNINKFERQKEKASFRSWLATITRNRVRDQFRKLQKNPAGYGGTEALNRFQALPDQPNGDGSDSQARNRDDLDHSISLLSLDSRLPRRVLEIVKNECDERTWQAFWMTTVKGDSAADVAERLGMQLSSVYQAKSRILRRLRKRMEELP